MACDGLWQDVRFGLRILARSPGSAVLVVCTLAVALGVNTAIFSVLNAALFKMLPVRHADELVILSDPDASMVLGGMLTGERSLFTYPEFTQLRDRLTTMSSVCAASLTLERWPVRIGASAPEQVRGRLVSENYFSTFGVRPALGRFFTGTDATGVGKDPYAVISYDYWQRRLGGRPDVLGTAVRINKAALVIIGVAPQGFRGDTVGQDPDLWAPILMQPLLMPGFDQLSDTMGTSQAKFMWLHVFGRRKPRISIAQVQAEVNVLFRAIMQASYPITMTPQSRREALNQYVKVRPLGTGAFHGRREFSQQWTLLLALAGLVLLVACANVANLLLVRGAARAREVAIRRSIGSGTVRIVRQFLTESVLLALLGGIGGVLVAEIGSRVLSGLVGEANQDFALAAGLDMRVLLMSACATLLTGVVFGVAPAFQAMRQDVNKNLKGSGRGVLAPGGRAGFRKALVVAQIAFSLLLAIGAGLFVRTLRNLESVDLGYPQKNLLLVRVDPLSAGHNGLESLNREVTVRIRQLPGVAAVASSDRGLFSGFEGAFAVEAEGFTSSREADRGSTGDFIGPDYFATIGIPILLGRAIDARDLNGRARVCVINEAFAQHFFAGRNPIGRHVTTTLSDDQSIDFRARLEVIGVAKNVRVQSLRGAIDPKFYIPGDGWWFEVRTKADPALLVNTVRAAIRGVDDNLTIDSVRTLSETVAMQNAQPRIIAQLSTGFGLLALFVSIVGVYGLVSFGVARRTNEIGIRMALGADGQSVAGMILKETTLLIGAGVCAGLALTAAAVQLLSSQLYGLHAAGPRWSLANYEHVDSALRLYGLRASDPLTIIPATMVLCALTLAAALIPAARAARVDPARALRNE